MDTDKIFTLFLMGTRNYFKLNEGSAATMKGKQKKKHNNYYHCLPTRNFLTVYISHTILIKYLTCRRIKY